MEKRKITFLIYSLCGGGAERVLVETVNHLNRDKYEITLRALFHDDTRAKMLKEHVKYKPVFRLNSKLFQKIISGMIQYLLPPAWVYHFFFQNHDDVEVAFLEAFPTKILAYSSNIHSKKYAWVHIDVNVYTKQDRLYRSLVHQQKCYAKYDKIYCVSEDVKKAFVKKFGLDEKVEVVYNILDENEIFQKRQQLCMDIPKDRFLIVSVGSLIKRKGFDRLIRVCRRLKDNGASFYTLILGKGELQEELYNLIQEEHLKKDIKLMGFRSNPYPYIAAADLYVCPSYVEGFSTVVSEAVVLGIPIVTTESSGMREILGNSEFGMITENSEDALYEGIYKMMQDKVCYCNYAKKVKERSAFFSMEKRLEEYENILDQ